MLHRRESGILLPIFSLPGPYGIGSLGAPARAFVDFLAQAGQHNWQILPLVPPGEGASPYMSPSSFAGNPFLIDLEELAQEGLLTQEELSSARRPDPDRVDYDFLYATRLPLLRLAWQRTGGQYHPLEEAPWLSDYTAFMALHDRYHTAFWNWPDSPAPPTEAEMDFHRFLQSVFYRQWFALKAYANTREVRLIGDLPIYVSPDSVEMWRSPRLFQLGEDGRPAWVAGVPPDAFSATGQLWGNPLYDWTGNPKEVYAWWRARMAWSQRLYDTVRIDHFRGFHTYWAVPAGAETALEGHWEDGPGMALLDDLHAALPNLDVIAEDLGDLDQAALDFIRASGLPGMKVLVYAFDPTGESAYLPHNCPPDSVVYTGTHDTPTFVQWLFQLATPAEREFASAYLRLRAEEGFGWGAICGAWASPARLAVAPMQDVLGLGGDARTNAPGTVGPQNWSWRVRQEALNPAVAARLWQITRTYRRC
jgi:4-alpha-glucanotransferase